MIRHSTAMALLQSGVDVAVIGLWLGHEGIETTNAYLHANLAIKEKALAKVNLWARRFADFSPMTPCCRSWKLSNYVNSGARKPAPRLASLGPLNIVRQMT